MCIIFVDYVPFIEIRKTMDRYKITKHSTIIKKEVRNLTKYNSNVFKSFIY